MDNVRKFIPKNVVPMFETVELEPIVKFDFEIEIIDHTGQVEGLEDGRYKAQIFSSDDLK